MRDDTGSDGFTLIETLVALVIFVASYLLIQQAVSLGWRGVQVAQSESGAARLAQSLMTAAGVETQLQEGQQTGATPDGYSWSVDIKRRADPSMDDTAKRLAGYWVTVDVTWPEGPLRTRRSLQLATLKLRPGP
jgi:prepilin-type N-terminal cleavage/methylation domain-containing protein